MATDARRWVLEGERHVGGWCRQEVTDRVVVTEGPRISDRQMVRVVAEDDALLRDDVRAAIGELRENDYLPHEHEDTFDTGYAAALWDVSTRLGLEGDIERTDDGGDA